MKLAWTAVVLGLALAAGVQDEFKKIVPDIEGAKRSARKLSKEGRERVEKAIERKLDEKEANVQIWEGRASVPEANANEKVRVLYAVVGGKGPKGEFKVGVVVAPDERVLAGVRVIENKDDPAIASDDFLLKFDNYIYSANISNPGSALDQARRTGAERKDATAKQVDGIFKLHALMHPVGAAWASLQGHLDKESKDAAADGEQIAKLFGEVEKVLPDFTFLKQSQTDSFRRRLKDSTKELGTFVQHAKAGKIIEARAVAAEIYNMSCRQCHAGTKRIFRDKRAELGIGNGYFVAGHDVEKADGPKESIDALLKAIRLGVLILSEAK